MDSYIRRVLLAPGLDTVATELRVLNEFVWLMASAEVAGLYDHELN